MDWTLEITTMDETLIALGRLQEAAEQYGGARSARQSEPEPPNGEAGPAAPAVLMTEEETAPVNM